MTLLSLRLWACTALLYFFTPALASAQGTGPTSRVQLSAGAGFLTSGTYFTRPGSLELANGDGLAGALEVSVTVHQAFAVVLAAAHARPHWKLNGVPLIGSVDVPGARLWFADAALRAKLPLGSAPSAPAVFAQAGGGVAHYAISTSVLGTSVDEQATNVALALGAGLALPVTSRLGFEVMAKDYIASFKGVRDLAAFGIEGRVAHTVLLLVSARLGL